MVAALAYSSVPKWAAAVNSGWIFFGAWLGIFAILLIFKKLKCGPAFTAIGTVAAVAVMYLICGSAIIRMPAGLFRMGIGIRSLSFGVINLGFGIFLVRGFLIVCLLWKRQKGVDAAAAEELERLKAEAAKSREATSIS